MHYYLLEKKVKLYLLLIGTLLAFMVPVRASGVKVAGNVSGKTNRLVPPNQIASDKADTKITGIVTNEANKPLSDVSVSFKGTRIGQKTDANGRFTISVPDVNGTLIFTGIGFVSQEITIDGRTELSVKLVAATKALNEVIVVGYGSQRRATVTGAITSLSASTITALPVASVDQALQGRVAGLNVTSNGSPGTAPIVTIRGISSISFASDPLYVVDGFPLNGSLTSFDPHDIENVQVLKDASAAAIYGSRATNGVILLTTKKGSRSGKVSISLDSYVGIQSPAKYLDLLNTNQYVQYATALDGAGGLPPRFLPANFNAPVYAGASQTYAQTNTDWQHEYFKRNAVMTSNTLSLNGGNEVSRFYSSVGYFKQDGIAQALSYERLNYRINSDHIVSKFLTVGENVYISGSTQHYDATSGNRTPITNVVRMQPYIPISDPTKAGGFQGPISSFDGSDPTNPVEAALIGTNKINSTNILGSMFAELTFTPWLRYKGTFGANYINNYTQNYTPIYNDGGTLNAATASIAYQRQSYFNRLFTNQLTFDKTFDKNHVTALAVYETQSLHYNNQTESGTQNTNLVQTLNGAGNIAANNTKEDNVLQSLVGRVTYDYAGKYLLNASLRRDGYSVWAPSHKYANFPAVSAGWNINQEEFLKDNKTISELKLRGGYGITGINPSSVGNYPYLSQVQINQAYYPIGGGIGVQMHRSPMV